MTWLWVLLCVVAGLDASAPTPAASPVDAFAAWTSGADVDVPWGPGVVFTVTGDPVATLSPGVADRPAAWVGCPAGVDGYEGRDCPVSLHGTVAALLTEGGHVVVEDAPSEVVGCSRYEAPEADAWLRPDRAHRSCFTDFAVAVTLDRGRVVAVDLALSGP